MAVRNWKLKAFAQKAFSKMPAGHRVNMVFQKATGGLPLSDAGLASSCELALHHLDAVQRHLGSDPADLSFFEFGAGFDLHMPLLLRSRGAGHQHVVDIRPLARPDLVADILRRIEAGDTDCTAPEPLPAWTDEPMLDYLESLGIRYQAPADARATDLSSDAIQVITSTNTLEHIPPADIASIYRECRRIVAPTGVLSFQIDYSDHYSHFDPSVSPYNFLRYDERQWRRYNNDLHYQNRLRHADHVELLEQAGFTILECTTTTGTDAERAALAQLDLAAPFAGRPLDELAILTSRMVLRPATS